MTREEAKNLVYTYTEEMFGKGYSSIVKSHEYTVNKIYDDFESRSCNSCISKHCDVKRVLVSNDQMNPYYFHCNDWEPEDE